jgi:enterochelin esterase-like enzyme
MRRFILLFIVLLIPAGFIFSADGIRIQESVTFFSHILKQDVKYSVCLPEDYSTSEKNYPVVYLLHGLGDDESSWLEYGRISQFAEEMVRNREIVPMIFIMPQGFRNYYVNDYAGTFLYQDMFVKELVPLIDSLYRTIKNTHNRAVMGYSMGGFGALVLPLKYPGIFSVAVPMSISIRTDEQYIIEKSEEWDEQWGKLFGGVGKIGTERITAYYKENCPFHIIENADLKKYVDLKIYIDNGDDEQTLCRSNEELHILMRKKSFPHEFRIRNGGHEFDYWRSGLPNGLRFISDAFNAEKYRGDLPAFYPPKIVNRITIIEKEAYSIIFPGEFKSTTRLYPVIYFMGSFNSEQKEHIGSLISLWTESENLPPVIIIFLNKTGKDIILTSIISETERLYRVRKGYRFRALVAFGESGNDALKLSLEPLRFTSCAIFNTNPEFDITVKVLKVNDLEKTGKTWFYIENPDKGLYFENNGLTHILLREENIYHEYRVSEGKGGWDWFMSGLYDSIIFTVKKIHK